MSSKLKLVLFGINIACLLVTLLYPNAVTPYSLIPIVVASSTWIFTSNSDQQTKRFPLVVSIAYMVICILVGTTSTIGIQPGQDTYVIKVNPTVAFFANIEYSYWSFFLVSIFSIGILGVCEIISSYEFDKAKINEKKSFADIVAQKL